MSKFTNTPEYFDSRDAIERIAELEDRDLTPELSFSEEQELEKLIALRDEAEEREVGEWEFGIIFVREDCIADHAEEALTEFIGLDSIPSWVVIDWEETAKNYFDEHRTYQFRETTYYAC